MQINESFIVRFCNPPSCDLIFVKDHQYSLPKTIEFFFRTKYSRPLKFILTPSGLFSLRLMFEHSELESLRDVSVTKIGDTLSYGFPQTEYCILVFVIKFFFGINYAHNIQQTSVALF